MLCHNKPMLTVAIYIKVGAKQYRKTKAYLCTTCGQVFYIDSGYKRVWKGAA